ncbi:TRPT1 [Mytilus coruscus]|uniref:2'-phosphotransferase n=1 Tax=Mytilus coruscus TaxID=42192 RepID=A0A6J8CLR3_MYTCO|nr:TRPT1 [Mytilus coruscus]
MAKRNLRKNINPPKYQTSPGGHLSCKRSTRHDSLGICRINKAAVHDPLSICRVKEATVHDPLSICRVKEAAVHDPLSICRVNEAAVHDPLSICRVKEAAIHDPLSICRVNEVPDMIHWASVVFGVPVVDGKNNKTGGKRVLWFIPAREEIISGICGVFWRNTSPEFRGKDCGSRRQVITLLDPEGIAGYQSPVTADQKDGLAVNLLLFGLLSLTADQKDGIPVVLLLLCLLPLTADQKDGLPVVLLLFCSLPITADQKDGLPEGKLFVINDLQLQMSVVNINTCSFQELLQLPGIGIKTEEQKMDIREGKGFVTESDLATISHLRVTMALLSRLDFSQNGGGQNIGPPPEDQGRHDEMLNRVNTVVDGGHIVPQGTPSRVHGQSAFKQEAWHQGQSPGHWGGPSQMDSAFLECSPYPGEAGARPKTPENWDGGYREQLKKKEWSHHIIGDPNQGNPPHQGSSIGNKPHWPGEVSAWDKNVPTKGGTPSYPRGHASNYAGQGSAPCTQPAHTGVGQYETPRGRYGKWQDNRGEDTRQTTAHTYGERQDNRGEDTRQAPAHTNGERQDNRGEVTRQIPARAYGDRQSQNQYNQGYTPGPPQGVTAGGSYGQQAYPVAYNEDRPRENTRGPDSRAWTCKERLSGFPGEGSNLQGSVKQNCNGTIKLQRDYSGGRSESLRMKLGLLVVESVPQARVAEVAIMIPGVDANLPRDMEGNGESRVSVEVRAESESGQSSISEEEATPSGRLDRNLLNTLANILRHGDLELGHKLLPVGYLFVEEILKGHPDFAGYSLPDIYKLVKVDVDKRFTLMREIDSGCWKIRANQGHSLVVDTPDIPLVEKNEPQAPLEVEVQIDVQRAQAKGYKFFWSPKGAVLCPGNQEGIILPTYVIQALHLDSGEELDLGNLVIPALLTGDQESSVANIEGKA